jgi:PP-loop superfamily ATP-utilizing enzyme
VFVEDKINELDKLLRSFGKVVIAFSGGVDSTFLLLLQRRRCRKTI